MKKLQSFRPKLITKEFFPDYSDPSVINEGECFIWAYLAYSIFKDVELWYNDCHAFVRYRGKFYDSETLKGSTNWQDLPATEGGGIPSHVTALHFKDDWSDQTIRFSTTWKELDKRARKVLRREQAPL